MNISTLILIGIMISLALATLIWTIAKVLAPTNLDDEKGSQFECGFTPFKACRDRVQIRFYLIGLLFVIFDLEISLIVPFAVIAQHIGNIGITAYWVLIAFIGVLTVGLVWEWQSGALDWE